MSVLKGFEIFSPIKTTFSERKNAIVYTRVSTKDQADNNTSLATQKNQCDNLALQKGYTVLAHFGGTYESAKSDERNEFKRMIKFAKQNKTVGYIIVYSYDRFSRTGANASAISKELQDLGIQVVAVSQVVDTKTASGVFQQNLFYLFSQFDNDLRRDKTITGMSELLRKGYWLWTPPRGYVNTKKFHKAVDWNIEIDKEGELLKKAFDWRVQNKYSNADIVHKLNLMGMKICERRLSEIFKNPFYSGILISKMLPGEVILGNHEPLISQKDFLRLNNPEISTHPKEHKTDNDNLPLKSFVNCSECNTPLTGFLVKAKGLYYYKCRTKGCSTTKNARQLHENFKDELSLFEINPIYYEVIKDVMEYKLMDFTKENKEEKITVTKKLNKLRKKLDSVDERFAIGEINNDLHQKFSSQYKNEIEEILKKSGNSEITSSNLKKCIKKAIDTSKNISKTWEVANLHEKKKIQNLVFPDGIGYDKQNDRVQTFRTNSLFSYIPAITKELAKNKKGENTSISTFSSRVTAIGFKPITLRAEI
jgi:site-specific DNA recombinase